MIETVVLSSVASAVYGIVGYIKAKRREGEGFNLKKYGITILLGLIIGIVYGVLGLPLNENTIAMILSFMGLNSAVETLGKSI